MILDPTRGVGGIPLEHELGMEAVRQDGMKQLEEARQRAAAPSPARATQATS